MANSSVAASYSADAIKAAFLHRFSAYVEWPTATANTPFTIAVVGNDGVLIQLQQLLPDLTIMDRPARVRSVSSVKDLEGVQILYVGPGNAGRARPLLDAARDRPILVVTDEENGLASGSIINFLQLGSNLRFEVSLPAAERSGLEIKAGLLSVAARVERSRTSALDPATRYLMARSSEPACRSLMTLLCAVISCTAIHRA